MRTLVIAASSALGGYYYGVAGAAIGGLVAQCVCIFMIALAKQLNAPTN